MVLRWERREKDKEYLQVGLHVSSGAGVIQGTAWELLFSHSCLREMER